MNVPEASWPIRNVRLATPERRRWKIQKIAIRKRKAPPKAIVGAAKAGITTLCISPCHWTPPDPDWTSAAPTRPPISAWDELDGSPNHHVSRFQATAVVTNAPARFAPDAIATAKRGESARVETEVATAFAVSWNPFVKSNPSATTTTTTRRTSPPISLPVLDPN